MADKPLTWEEKLEKGIPLSHLDQVKADATRITKRRIRDQQEEQKLQKEQAEAPTLAEFEASQKEATPENSKKGN